MFFPPEHSIVLDRSKYDNRGLLPGMEARVHKDHKDCDLSMIGALEDWRELIGPTSPVYKGGLHQESISSVPISIPDCLPDRINIITYATEFGFLQDDALENAFEEEEITLTSGILAEGLEAIDDANNSRAVINKASTAPANGHHSAKNARKIQAWIISKILSIDPVRGKIALNAWKKFYEGNQDCYAGERTEYTTLEAYLKYRLEDVGCQYWAGMIIFGYGLTIPDHEMPLCRSLCRPGWVAFTLVNDVCSYDKEEVAAKQNGQSYISNAIYVMAQERGVSIDEAKKMGAQLLNDSAAEYIEIMKKAKADGGYSEDFMRFMDALYYSVSGSLVWSVSCPRYNTHHGAKLDDRQIDWMKNGIPDHLRRGDSMKSAAYNLQTGLQVKELLSDFKFDLGDLTEHKRKLAMYVSMGGVADSLEKLRNWRTGILSGLMTVVGGVAIARAFKVSRF